RKEQVSETVDLSTPSPYSRSEAVAICRGGAELGVQALVDDRVLRFEEEPLGEDRLSGVGHPSTHAASQAPFGACGLHPRWGILAGCLGTAFDHPRRVMRALL